MFNRLFPNNGTSFSHRHPYFMSFGCILMGLVALVYADPTISISFQKNWQIAVGVFGTALVLLTPFALIGELQSKIYELMNRVEELENDAAKDSLDRIGEY